MIIYADTSALVKLILEEPGSAEMQDQLAVSERMLSVALAYVELQSALAAAVRAGRVSTAAREERISAIEQVWQIVAEIPVEPALLREAARIAHRAGLRAYDAVHLAGLQASGEPDEVTFACYDRELRSAAATAGYQVFPETGV